MQQILIFILLAPQILWAHDSGTPKNPVSPTPPECMQMLSGLGTKSGQPTPNQRYLALGIEILKIKPPVTDSVPFVDVLSETRELSRANLSRLLAELPQPLPLRLTEDESDRIEEMAASLVPVAVTAHLPASHGPILPSHDFYANFVGGSKTVGLKYVATPYPRQISYFRAQVTVDSARPAEQFINQFGLVMPQFSYPAHILAFFAKWEPEAIEDVVQLNRYNLPHSVKSADQFLRYLGMSEVANQVLPEHALYKRLAPLRERLHRYAMLPSDAAVFFRHAVQLYMAHAIETGHKTMADFEKLFAVEGGAGFIFADGLRFVGWDEGAAVRVPLNVPVYSILRVNEIAPQQRLLLDRRRIDHKDMP